MRLLSTLKLTALTKLLPPIDLYTGLYVPQRMFSREHVIPKSVLIKANLRGASLWDIENLYCVDSVINHTRSNYKFAELPDFLSCTNVTGSTDRQIVMAGNDDGIQHLVFDLERRVFVPPSMCRGAIARTIYKMKAKYPQLDPFLPLVIDRRLMNEWLELPKCHAELLHDEFLKQHGI